MTDINFNPLHESPVVEKSWYDVTVDSEKSFTYLGIYLKDLLFDLWNSRFWIFLLHENYYRKIFY